MGKQNKIDSRITDELKEDVKTVDSNVPNARFQDKQQVEQPVDSGMSAKPNNSTFIPKTTGSKGSQLKQETVAKVITGTGGGSPEEGLASPSRAGLRTLAYSGNEGTILGNPSGTPFVGSPSRSDTRPGQKLDAVAKAIDYIAPELAVQDYDGSKPLQDNPTETQGFLGHPENTAARVQKHSEVVPGALLFSRSVDENMRDELVFVEGQMLKENGVTYKVDPTVTYDIITKSYKPFTSVRGNYIPKTMHLGVSTNGEVLAINFDVDDINESKNSDVINASSSAYVRAMNQDEMNRQNMENKAGVETESNWCPIVRAVNQPTPTVGYLTDDEITTGSEEFLGYRFVNKALSYFFNKAAKDGQTPYRSFREMLKGQSVLSQTSDYYENNRDCFSAYDYQNGAPSLMIALYDSINKYSKRGDLLVQPRSWKMHKQTADNNINPFRMHPNMAKYISARDVFSTIDRTYDPLLPVCISDSWRAIHVRNFNEMLNRAKAETFTTKLGGKGLTTAGTAFNTLYDITSGKDSLKDNIRLASYISSTVKDGSVYDYLGYHNSMRYDQKGVLLGFATDKTGAATYAEAYSAAVTKLNAYAHAGNNSQLLPIVILFKVKETDPNPDDVFALVRYPNFFTVNTTSPNVKLFIGYQSTYDYMASDTTVNLTSVGVETLENDYFTYKYQNRQNPYIVEVRNPLLHGILEWAQNLGGKLANPAVTDNNHRMPSLADGQNVIWYHIPIVHSTTNLSLWDLIICASVPFAQKIRTNSQFDVLNYEEWNGVYPFEQLKTISECNPLASENFRMTDILKPLEVGTMKPSTALSWILPEKFWRIAHTFDSVSGKYSSEKFIMPFYFSEEAFEFDSSSGTLVVKPKPDGHVMNYPTTRSGVRLSYLDNFYSMKERDIRLCLDMLTQIPGHLGSANSVTGIGVYKYGLSNSGIPVFDYPATDQLNIGAYLKAARELGLGMVAPAGYNSPALSITYPSNLVSYRDYTTLESLLSFGTSYKIRTWKVSGSNYQQFMDPMSVNISRSGNFAQDWAMRGDLVYGSGDVTNVEQYGYLNAHVNIGICLNFNDAMEVEDGTMVGDNDVSVFKPFTNGDTTQNQNLPSIITLQNVLWPRIQCLPYAVSPFDQTPEARDESGTDVTYDMTADPYDLAYICGFCGFKGSDYREDVFNRIYERLTLGWTYLTDSFITDSPVMK